MFANVMNQEEKENFLALIYRVATCDGDYAEEEQELVDSYKIELGVSDINEELTTDELIAYFATKENQLKKVVFFELYGMIMADSKITAEENQIYTAIQQSFQLGKSVYDSLVYAANTLQKAYDIVYDALAD